MVKNAKIKNDDPSHYFTYEDDSWQITDTKQAKNRVQTIFSFFNFLMLSKALLFLLVSGSLDVKEDKIIGMMHFWKVASNQLWHHVVLHF